MSDTGTRTKPSNVETVQDTPLTIREHLDPDKHWIGEALAPPTQGEIEATIGSSAGPGESPFVARADHKHKLEVVRSRIGRAAYSIVVGDTQHLGTGTFYEGSGGFTGAGTQATPLIVPSTGTYAVTLTYAGVNWGGASVVPSACSIVIGGQLVMLPMLGGTTVTTGGTIVRYCLAGTSIYYGIRNNSGATQANVVMYGEAVKVAMA